MAVTNVVVRGARGAGKSTLIAGVVETGRVRMAGVVTRKLASGVVTLRAWDNYSLYEQGPREVIRDEGGVVRTAGFETLGVWAISRALDGAACVVFDEIGRFESACPPFLDAVCAAFEGRKPVLAAMKAESTPFLDGLAGRADTAVFIITPRNREELRATVARALAEAFG